MGSSIPLLLRPHQQPPQLFVQSSTNRKRCFTFFSCNSETINFLIRKHIQLFKDLLLQYENVSKDWVHAVDEIQHKVIEPLKQQQILTDTENTKVPNLYSL